jgi:hypothetical protein
MLSRVLIAEHCRGFGISGHHYISPQEIRTLDVTDTLILQVYTCYPVCKWLVARFRKVSELWPSVP